MFDRQQQKMVGAQLWLSLRIVEFYGAWTEKNSCIGNSVLRSHCDKKAQFCSKHHILVKSVWKKLEKKLKSKLDFVLPQSLNKVLTFEQIKEI